MTFLFESRIKLGTNHFSHLCFKLLEINLKAKKANVSQNPHLYSLIKDSLEAFQTKATQMDSELEVWIKATKWIFTILEFCLLKRLSSFRNGNG